MRATDFERLHQEVRGLEAENEVLRRQAGQARAAVIHLERQFARQAGELASVYASRAWHVATVLRTLFRRRRILPARPRPAVPWVSPAEAGRPTPRIALIVLPGGRADAPLLARASLAGATCDVVLPGAPDAGNAVTRCNEAAATARADYIALWDGVSAPQPGWLQALAFSLARFEGAGMAGAVLLAPDGRLVAAGAAILSDGRLAPLGSGERADHPAFASVGTVEALPLGAVMIPADVWRRFGGLDEEIASPALALADFALRLREAGMRVLCTPFARLTAAAAPLPDPWAEAFGRWRVRRRQGESGNGLASLGLPPRPAPRALFVDYSVPTPDRDAASIDMEWYLRIFVALGYETTLLPVRDLARNDHYVDELRRHGVRVIANGFAASAPDFLARAPAPFDVILLYRASLAGGELFDQLRAHSPEARIVFNTVDLHFLRMEREALLLRSPEKLDEAFRVQQIELATITRADCSILLSPVEQPIIADLLPRARTCVIPIAREVTGRKTPFAARHGMVFVGGFRHGPNVDAVLAFVRETWPLIRRRLATTLSIVGADPPDEVRALHDPEAGVVVLGHVDDLDALLESCRLTVAPLRFGAGTKGKIVTSLTAGVPVVASPIAAEGMGLLDRLHVRVAATPETFADAAIEVHEQEALWTSLSDAGLEFAIETFSVAGARRRIVAMLRDLGLPAGP